jgi:hypothetical protein
VHDILEHDTAVGLQIQGSEPVTRIHLEHASETVITDGTIANGPSPEVDASFVLTHSLDGNNYACRAERQRKRSLVRERSCRLAKHLLHPTLNRFIARALRIRLELHSSAPPKP